MLKVSWCLYFCQELHHNSQHRGFATQQSESTTLSSPDIQPRSQWSYEDRSYSAQSAGESQIHTRHRCDFCCVSICCTLDNRFFFFLTDISHPALCLFSLQCSILLAQLSCFAPFSIWPSDSCCLFSPLGHRQRERSDQVSHFERGFPEGL